MATIAQDVAAIRTAVYGKDVREAIADGIENINDVATRAEREVVDSADDIYSALSLADSPLTWYDGQYIDSNGSGAVNPEYSFCSYVEIPPNSAAIARAYFSGVSRMALYDENKNVIHLYSNSVSYTKFDLILEPSTKTRYVRMSSYTAYKSKGFVKTYVPVSNVVSAMANRVEATNRYLTDCNNAEPNRIYTITTSVSNLPANVSGGSLVSLHGSFAQGANGNIQLLVAPNQNVYVRICWGSGSSSSWTSWRKIAQENNAMMEIGQRQTEGGTVLTDFNDAIANRIYTIVTPIDNGPGSRVGTLFTFNGDSQYQGGQVQMFVSNVGEVYSRMFWNNSGAAEWTPWQQLNSMAYGGYYSGIELFERFGVIGDSFASGAIITSTDTQGTAYYNLSWPQILGRMSGSQAVNYTRAGINTLGWLTDNTYGLPKLLADIDAGNACGLYIFCLGINDSNSTRDPGGLSYLGTVSDIHSDPDTNPSTFYGNYGKIIQKIMNKCNTKGVHSKFMMCNFRRIPTAATSEGYEPFRNAIVEIAQHFNIPCIKLDDDTFFTSPFYMNRMSGYHPTGPQYVGYAKAMERLISKAMVDNYDYFKEYVGI